MSIYIIIGIAYSPYVVDGLMTGHAPAQELLHDLAWSRFNIIYNFPTYIIYIRICLQYLFNTLIIHTILRQMFNKMKVET